MTSEQKLFDNMTEHFFNHHDQNNEFLNFEKLNYEEERIKSYVSWPVHFPVDPSRLAKAGFYYTGIADEVVCFSCQGHIKNWNYGDIVLKKHADLYPNCDFIKNRSNNIPLLKTSAKFKSQPLIIENVNVNANCSKSDSVDYDKMKLESERLKTFSMKWPLSFINITDLVHAGFFYTGIDCKVQCPYCKGVISSWEVDSIPIQEHFKQFPWCDFINQNISQIKKGPWLQSSSQNICGNIVKQTTSNSEGAPPSNKLISDNLQHTNLEDLCVYLYKGPFHPQQASLTARLKSFATWPSGTPVSKEDLAAAGFFYIGIGDRTICFHCNGGLCSWVEGDNPWVEHARWFPTCNFLLLNKGSDFIKACAMKDLSKMNYSYESGGLNSAEPILKKVDEAMKSNLVKYVIETELFPSHIVRAALLLQLKETGSMFATIDDLCVAASCLKEKLEKQSFDMKPVQAEDLNITKKFSESCSVSEILPVDNTICAISEETHSEKKDLKNDTEKLNSSEDDDLNDQYICKICMDRKVGVVFLPCGHLHACTICATALKHCPMCRKSIQATVKVYLD